MFEDIKIAVDVMNKGGVILYPTDTVWGIGCDATNKEAVAKIYNIKKREDSKSMLVLVDSVAKVQAYVDEMPDIAFDIFEYATKPTTIIFDKAKWLAENLIAEDGSIGIRVTNEEFSHKLCQRFKRPIVSTSANVSGQPTPAIFKEIDQHIIDAVDYVVGYRQDDFSKAKPSSIIKLTNKSEVKVIRE